MVDARTKNHKYSMQPNYIPIGKYETITVPPEKINELGLRDFGELTEYGKPEVKQHFTEQTAVQRIKELIQKIKDTNQEVKNKKDKLNTVKWKITRKCLVKIDQLGGHTTLGYNSFYAMCKDNFKMGFGALFEERRTAKYEELLELPLCSYSRSIFMGFEAIGVFPIYRGNQYGAVKDIEPIPERVELLKSAWVRVLELAENKPVSSRHVFKAVEELHERYPDMVRMPTSRNGAVTLQKKVKELERENTNLKVENAALKLELKNLKSKNG